MCTEFFANLSAICRALSRNAFSASNEFGCISDADSIGVGIVAHSFSRSVLGHRMQIGCHPSSAFGQYATQSAKASYYFNSVTESKQTIPRGSKTKRGRFCEKARMESGSPFGGH